jgi:lipopolysaccharide export system permease protein
MLVDFLGRVWEFLEMKIAYTIMFEYFISKAPWVIYHMIPVSSLLATLMTFSDLSKNNEIVAMYAGGISLWRLSGIMLFLGLFIAAFSFLVNEYLVPVSMAKVKYIQEVHISQNSYQTFKKDKIWYRSKNFIYNLQYYEPSEKTIQGITIYSFDKKFKIKKQVYAEKAKWVNNNWRLFKGNEIDYRSSNYPRVTEFDEREVILPEKPKDLVVIEKSTDTLSFRELQKYVDRSKRAGLKSRVYEVDMHSKLALPFACLIMILLALPFAMKHQRSGGVAVNLGFTFVFVLAYVFIQAISISYGHNGKIMPILAAWSANLFFFGIAMFNLSNAKT